jgi:hypothetical protein
MTLDGDWVIDWPFAVAHLALVSPDLQGVSVVPMATGISHLNGGL